MGGGGGGGEKDWKEIMGSKVTSQMDEENDEARRGETEGLRRRGTKMGGAKRRRKCEKEK